MTDNNNNNAQNQQYEPTPMQTDNANMNILAHMPTPVSNNISASSDANTFVSPLQVDQPGYDRLNAVRYSHRGNEDVCHDSPKRK